jgi:polyhydroxyalkanoate synthesis repressor PhaR
MSNLRLIKKYPNRRLYDTELSRYITIEDIRKLITARSQLRIVEQRSGRDITRSVLLQVISELEVGDEGRLSEAFLAELIRSYDLTPAGPTSNYLEAGMREFLEAGGRDPHRLPS